MKKAFTWLVASLVFWFIPVLFFACLYAGIWGTSISYAMRQLVSGNGVIVFLCWFIITLIVMGFQIWPTKDDPDFAEPKPVFNDIDEIINQKYIDLWNSTRTEYDNSVGGQRERIKELTADLKHFREKNDMQALTITELIKIIEERGVEITMLRKQVIAAEQKLEANGISSVDTPKPAFFALVKKMDQDQMIKLSKQEELVATKIKPHEEDIYFGKD